MDIGYIPIMSAPYYHPQGKSIAKSPSLVEDRRQPKRVPFSHYVFCRNRDQQFLARGVDLSAQGLALFSNVNPPIGSLWDVIFQIPGDGNSLKGKAMVVRSEERSGSFWALRFVDSPSEFTNPLEKFVERQFYLSSSA